MKNIFLSIKKNLNCFRYFVELRHFFWYNLYNLRKRALWNERLHECLSFKKDKFYEGKG